MILSVQTQTTGRGNQHVVIYLLPEWELVLLRSKKTSSTVIVIVNKLIFIVLHKKYIYRLPNAFFWKLDAPPPPRNATVHLGNAEIA